MKIEIIEKHLYCINYQLSETDLSMFDDFNNHEYHFELERVLEGNIDCYIEVDTTAYNYFVGAFSRELTEAEKNNLVILAKRALYNLAELTDEFNPIVLDTSDEKTFTAEEVKQLMNNAMVMMSDWKNEGHKSHELHNLMTNYIKQELYVK